MAAPSNEGSPPLWDESTHIGSGTTPSEQTQPPSSTSADRYYLVVFQGDASAMFQLPRTGEVVIGRSEGAQLRLHDTQVSRQHAKIVMSSGEALVCDVGSQNGTRLNGERLTGSRPLVSGDVITLGGTVLVFHSSARPTAIRSVLEFAPLRQRADEELERSLRYQRPLAVIDLILGVGAPARPEAVERISPALRRMDVMGWGGPDELLVLMPEVDGGGAEAGARRLLAALAPVAPSARAGIACFPAAGCDVESLLGSARAAALESAASEIASATGRFRTLEIGQQRLVVADPAMTRLYALVERLAVSDLPVLIYGETGTGKELAASALHHWSKRREGPLVAFNCAALQESLVESELFGHEKGAFTGAVGSKPGIVERADGGTLFLDEVGELSAAVQAKLLRALETKRVTRLGDTRERAIDIRLVAATNRNLEKEVETGRFRRDLFFRLSGGMLWLPPLRDRARELPILAETFLAQACARSGRAPMRLSDGAMRALATYAWPGNIRELKNLMEYLAAAVAEPLVEAGHVAERLGEGAEAELVAADAATGEPPPGGAFLRPLEEEIRELERRRIEEALRAAGGNQTEAAALIRMPLRTFQARIRQYNLGRSRATHRRR